MPELTVRETNRQNLEQLRLYESRNVTYLAADGSWPVVWQRARGVYVWDLDGRRYLDLTAAFGVAAAGHANPRVVAAGCRQAQRLLHAMGDVHPHPLKARLARELSRITFERWSQQTAGDTSDEAVDSPVRSVPGPSSARGKTIFCNSGFEAVEAALKTALLATGKPGVIAFTGAYHGLGYGALNVTHRPFFRAPFQRQLAEFAQFAPFPTTPEDLDRSTNRLQRILRRQSVGAVLVEPVQGRGGVRVPAPDFLSRLRQLCDQQGAILIADEIYTGFGRTGRWFACEHWHVQPDIICLGKALTGGFPLSACVGRADLMDAAWPTSPGEALHTSTYLGHPVGCAMALAQIEEIRRRGLVAASQKTGAWLLSVLRDLNPPPALRLETRGLGLMAGVEVRHRNGKPATRVVLKTITRLLQQGFILLPEGAESEVISFTPPLTIRRAELATALAALQDLLHTPSCL